MKQEQHDPGRWEPPGGSDRAPETLRDIGSGLFVGLSALGRLLIFLLRPFARSKVFLWTVGLFLALAIIGALAIVEIIHPFRKRADSFDLAKVRKVETASVVYDRNENVLGSLFIENRRPVSIDEIPPHLIDALLATEDSRFYEHDGIDLMGIARAVVTNFLQGRKAQGASTITQQLARQTFEMREVSYERKLTEMFLARRIEAEYTKTEIVQHYLNLIYFGSSFYGIESAAQGYFGKHVSDLTVSESAVLVALIKRPNPYNPFRDVELAKGARDRTLARMYDLNFLTEKEYNAILAEPITALDSTQRSSKGLHVMGEIRRRLDKIFEETNGPREGVRVYTSIDAELERKIRTSVNQRLADFEAKQAAEGRINSRDDPLEAAAIIIRNDTGELLASVGGRNFRRSEFDRAFRAKRMMGTAFTPFVYAAAIEGGIDPYEEVLDAPLDNREVMIGALEGIVGEWGAEDGNNEYEGRISAWKAIVSSKNAATVRLGKKLESDQILGLVQRAGFTSELKVAPSTILGQTEVTPAELTLAYSAFANGGTRPESIVIVLKVLDEQGEVIYKNPATSRQIDVMQPMTARHVHSALATALERGTGATSIKELGLKHMPAGGKTGTAYNFTDAWFLGYNSALTCGVWVGHDRPRTISNNAYGSVMALPIWVDAMNASFEDNLPDQIPPPPGTEKVLVCDYTGEAATEFCTEPRLVPHVSAKPLFVSCTHREYLLSSRIRSLQPCSRHTAEHLPPGTEIFATTPAGKQIRSAQLLVEAIYPQAHTLIGDDPYGSLAIALLERPKVIEPEPGKEEEPMNSDVAAETGETVDGLAVAPDEVIEESNLPVARPVVLPPSDIIDGPSPAESAVTGEIGVARSIAKPQVLPTEPITPFPPDTFPPGPPGPPVPQYPPTTTTDGGTVVPIARPVVLPAKPLAPTPPPAPPVEPGPTEKPEILSGIGKFLRNAITR